MTPRDDVMGLDETVSLDDPSIPAEALSVDTGTLDKDGERVPRERGGTTWIASVGTSAREIARERKSEKKCLLKSGRWPGWCASIQGPDGRWRAVIEVNTGEAHRYRCTESLLTYRTSEEAFEVAERMLQLELKARRGE